MRADGRRRKQIKMTKSSTLPGVNLGNWLVLEKWMDSPPFRLANAADEVRLTHELTELNRLTQINSQEIISSDEELRRRLKQHRDAYITQEDFKYLANSGIKLVRLPVPFFVLGIVRRSLDALIM